MVQLEVFHTSEYESRLLEVSDSLLERVIQLESSLSHFPKLGSPLVRPSIKEHFGTTIRKVVLGSWLVIYRHDDDKIYLLSLVPAKAVR